jgi:lysophospholipase L1-like esterase
MRPLSSWRGALGALALALAGIAAALGLAELGLRVVAAAGRSEPAAVDPEIAALPEIDGIFALTRPNARGRNRGVLWRTNGAGFRGPDRSPVPAPGVFRIAVVGDSFSAGDGVREEDTYAAQIERLLAGSGAAVRFEVLNVGLGGLDIEQVLLRATHVASRFRPHLYVYGFTLNDIDRGAEAEQRFQNEENRRLAQETLRFAGSPSLLLRSAWPRWVSLRAWLAGGGYAGTLAQTYRDPEKFARIERGLDGFHALAEQSGVCVHVLIHTELSHLRFGHPFREAYDRVERAARARGLSATQSFPAHRWRNSGALRVSLVDGHPNAEGHRLLAEALYAGLRELPPHCRFPVLP